MDEQIFNQEMSNNMLVRVKEGMKVVDQQDHEVGRVDTVYFGEVSQEANDAGQGPQDVSRADLPAGEESHPVGFAFGGAVFGMGLDEVDEVIRNRMLREGYVKVDSGLLSRDVYVLADQIAAVSGERVELRVDEEDLIRP
jgi:hypothetical protein